MTPKEIEKELRDMARDSRYVAQTEQNIYATREHIVLLAAADICSMYEHSNYGHDLAQERIGDK